MNVVIGELVKEITSIRDGRRVILDLVVELEDGVEHAVGDEMVSGFVEQSEEAIEQESGSSKFADVVA